MSNELTIEEMDLVHLSLITRERVVRERWLPIARDIEEKQKLEIEADTLSRLQKKVCAAKLSKELGFEIEPVA